MNKNKHSRVCIICYSQLFGRNSIRILTLEKLLNHHASPPILGLPDFSQLFVLHTNASQEGRDAVSEIRWQKCVLSVIIWFKVMYQGRK